MKKIILTTITCCGIALSSCAFADLAFYVDNNTGYNPREALQNGHTTTVDAGVRFLSLTGATEVDIDNVAVEPAEFSDVSQPLFFIPQGRHKIEFKGNVHPNWTLYQMTGRSVNFKTGPNAHIVFQMVPNTQEWDVTDHASVAVTITGNNNDVAHPVGKTVDVYAAANSANSSPIKIGTIFKNDSNHKMRVYNISSAPNSYRILISENGKTMYQCDPQLIKGKHDDIWAHQGGCYDNLIP